VSPSFAPVWRLFPLHQEALLVGWLLNLAMGTAYWILPRVQHSRGPEAPVWAALALLNGGVAAVAVATVVPESASALVLAGRSGELTAALLFAGSSWRRIFGLAPRLPRPDAA
jgi:hypothetical protein